MTVSPNLNFRTRTCEQISTLRCEVVLFLTTTRHKAPTRRPGLAAPGRCQDTSTRDLQLQVRNMFVFSDKGLEVHVSTNAVPGTRHVVSYVQQQQSYGMILFAAAAPAAAVATAWFGIITANNRDTSAFKVTRWCSQGTAAFCCAVGREGRHVWSHHSYRIVTRFETEYTCGGRELHDGRRQATLAGPVLQEALEAIRGGYRRGYLRAAAAIEKRGEMPPPTSPV